MRTVSRYSWPVGLTVAAVIALSISAFAATFSDASVKGSYGFLTSLTTANASTNQFAMVGVMSFDGAGNVTGSYTSISHDAVLSGSLAGTYSVNSNGTGTITLTSGSTAQFTITLFGTAAGVSHNLELLQINDTSNEIISGTAVLQATTAQTYSLASLKGTMGFQYNPHTADSSLAEDGGTGLFTFDGKGHVTSSQSVVYDGGLLTGSGSFNYSVNADGTGTITPTGKGPSFAFALNTVAAGKGKGFQFLDTNTSDGPGNLVITGSAQKQ